MPALAVAPNPDSPSDRSGAAHSPTLEVALREQHDRRAPCARRTASSPASWIAGSGGCGDRRSATTGRRSPMPRDRPVELPPGYAPLDELFDHGADAVVVTGAEPLCERLVDEGSWAQLRHLLEWIAEGERPALLSCLAAHAALLVYDGIERRRFPPSAPGYSRSRSNAHHALGRGPARVGRDAPLPVQRRPRRGPRGRRLRAGPPFTARSAGRSPAGGGAGRAGSGPGPSRVLGHDPAARVPQGRRRYLDGITPELPILPRRCIDGPKGRRPAPLPRATARRDRYPVPAR